MGAFDTAMEPKAVAPADTNPVALLTASADCSVLVDVSNEGIDAVKVRVGITPDGGSVHWKVYDAEVPVGNPITSLGPYALRAGDAITVRTDTPDDAVFSATGVESS